MSLSLLIAGLILGGFSMWCWIKEFEGNKFLLAIDVVITIACIAAFSGMGVVGGIIGLGVSNVLSVHLMKKMRR